MTTNPTYKPSESKREEFRKYLEKNGVMDALTKVLVNLYEEPQKPEDALEYIRDKLAVLAGLETYKEMAKKLEDSEERARQLESAAPVGQSGSQVSAQQAASARASAVQEPTSRGSAAPIAESTPRASGNVIGGVDEEQPPEEGEAPPAEGAPAEEAAGGEGEQPPPEEGQ